MHTPLEIAYFIMSRIPCHPPLFHGFCFFRMVLFAEATEASFKRPTFEVSGLIYAIDFVRDTVSMNLVGS